MGNIQNQFSQQPQNPFRQQPRPQQQLQQQPQRQAQLPPTPAAPSGDKSQTLSLFEQIKQRINREKQLKSQIIQQQNEKEQQQQTFRQPQPQQNFRQPQQSFQQNLGSFGVFEAVDLSGPSPSPLP